MGDKAGHPTMTDGPVTDDKTYMRLALAEARKSPPSALKFSVGALLVARSSSTVLATGYSLELPGNTHAEQCCLLKFAAEHACTEAEAGFYLPDDTVLYTTMEPCDARLSGNRPCVDTIIACRNEHGPAIGTVFVGVKEPNTFLAVNKGEKRLRDSGINVVHVTGLEDEILAIAKSGHA